MARLTTTLLMATALVATAACSKKRPEVLPPAPGEAPAATAPTTGGAPVDGVASGSAADFRRSITSDTINFGLDMSDVDDSARAILDTQAQWLARYPSVRVTVEGHADERGTREYNLALGERRANSAKNYLAAKGISPSRITTISYGKERPVALGSDEESWAQNRRAVTVAVTN